MMARLSHQCMFMHTFTHNLQAIKGKNVSVKIKVMQGRTSKKYGNKAEMKAPQATLLPDMAKKEDKEDYTTSVAKSDMKPDCVAIN